MTSSRPGSEGSTACWATMRAERSGSSTKPTVTSAATVAGLRGSNPGPVVRAENAARVLPLLEAPDLAEILETTLDRLAEPSGEAQAVESLDAAGWSVVVAHEVIARGVHDLLMAVAAVREIGRAHV